MKKRERERERERKREREKERKINLIKKIDKKIFFNLLRTVYRFFFYLKTKFALFSLKKNKNFFNIIFYSHNNNLLTKLCEFYKSDKGSINHHKKGIWGWRAHTYSNYYYSLFNHFKDDVKLVFECGIGTNNPDLPSNMTVNGIPGASLRVWRDYFKNAQIYGADIDKNILFQEDRIKTYYVDQLNTPSIETMWKRIGIQNFDIIIDDGLHANDANINFFINSFDKLKKNGIYIIEDVSIYRINNIMEKLKKFNPELISLHEKNLICRDNNLVIIRND
jgi:hypothetical protein